jgi:hypothetical protein
MHSTLDSIVKSSPTIVIAKFVAPKAPADAATSYELVVERALRGSVPKGRLRVKPSPDGHAYFAAGTRVVAFVNGCGSFMTRLDEREREIDHLTSLSFGRDGGSGFGTSRSA